VGIASDLYMDIFESVPQSPCGCFTSLCHALLCRTLLSAYNFPSYSSGKTWGFFYLALLLVQHRHTNKPPRYYTVWSTAEYLLSIPAIQADYLQALSCTLGFRIAAAIAFVAFCICNPYSVDFLQRALVLYFEARCFVVWLEGSRLRPTLSILHISCFNIILLYMQ